MNSKHFIKKNCKLAFGSRADKNYISVAESSKAKQRTYRGENI